MRYGDISTLRGDQTLKSLRIVTRRCPMPAMSGFSRAAAADRGLSRAGQHTCMQQRRCCNALVSSSIRHEDDSSSICMRTVVK
jgi:hypothetical protein